jgi:hypothetical protein
MFCDFWYAVSRQIWQLWFRHTNVAPINELAPEIPPVLGDASADKKNLKRLLFVIVLID